MMATSKLNAAAAFSMSITQSRQLPAQSKRKERRLRMCSTCPLVLLHSALLRETG